MDWEVVVALLLNGSTVAATLLTTRRVREHLQEARDRSRRVAIRLVGEGEAPGVRPDVIHIGDGGRAIRDHLRVPSIDRRASASGSTQVVDAQPKHVAELANRAAELKRQILEIDSATEDARRASALPREPQVTRNVRGIPNPSGSGPTTQLLDVSQNEDAVAALDSLVKTFNEVFQALGPPPPGRKDPESTTAGDGGPAK